jgi:3',5'-cyclic AMP phosphodiesterase CpdA
MNDRVRPLGHAIIHLTDLHFPSGPTEPAWADALTKAFQRLAENDRIQIMGLAVTGDLVDSPQAEIFGIVRSFLVRAALCLKLTKPVPAPSANRDEGAAANADDGDRVDWDRVWIIDGNHDYRRWGLFKSSWLGIEEGRHLKRFQRYSAQGDAGSILLLGLNSSDQGSWARGRVTLDGLRTIQRNGRDNGDPIKYRVALVHHHLLPLPDRPAEFDRGAQKIKRKVYDESTKLLSNAGLVTNILLESSIDLVLHGHEHKQFAASVKYHDRGWSGHIMSVVGGPAANSGFQVITFAASGDAELTRYENDETDYRIATRFFLWRYEDWKRVSWERLRRDKGYFRKAIRRSKLAENGDFQQLSDVTDVFGGETDIEEIVISSKTDDPTSGVVAIDRVRDKAKSDDVPASKLPPCGNELEYHLVLEPSAKQSAPHPGYFAIRISGDNFLLTREEMEMRRPGGPYREFTRFHYPYPVEHLIVTLDFPPRYAPRQVEARARLRLGRGMPEDVAETLRIRRNIFYDPNRGQVWLSLDWVAPNHQYEIAWELPSEADVDARNHDRATLGAHYLAKCLALSSSALATAAGALVMLRQRCFKAIQTHAGIRDEQVAVFQPQCDELSLWAFDREQGQIRTVAATYQDTSPFWRARLSWAAGVRGRAMRRHAVEYYRKRTASTHSNYYHRLENCGEETHLLCVPVFLPPDSDGKDSGGACRMVAVLASTSDSSLLHHLQNVALREQVAELIFFEISDLIKKIVPLGA